jgi:flagellar FliJ protein
MKRFAFRAQAALDLRRRQEDDARRELAAAEARAREAAASLAHAIDSLNEVLQRGGEQEARGGDVAARIWYRNWIVGQRQRIARCRQVLLERQAAVAEAARCAQLARRKVRTLERFRERAWRHYLREESREEQKALDELGTVRFALRRTGAGGHT